MKLAHLILAHSNPEQLKRLIGRLVHTDVDFYIHLDKKTDIAPFLTLADMPNVHFIQKRIKVYWGDYSIVEATVSGFEEILATGIPYDYIHLMSGQDYPIKSTAHIHGFLAANPGKIFMQYQSVEDEWHEAIPRIKKYYLSYLKIPKGTYQIEQLLNSVLPVRKLPAGIVAVGRSQWFTASRDSVAYIVEYMRREKWISRFFKFSWAADEMIFQTILYNSPFKDQMVNDNLLYLDWSAGAPSPKMLTIDDLEALTRSDKLFARKFNSDVDSEILDYIDNIATVTTG